MGPSAQQACYTLLIPGRSVIATAPKHDARDNITAARQFAIDAARLLANTRCHNIVILDVRGLSPVTDFMVLATGTSDRQMHTACRDAEELGEQRGFRAFSRAGDNSQWVCIDLVDVVIHVFSQEARSYYDLDNLWGDARKTEWQDVSATPAASTIADQG